MVIIYEVISAVLSDEDYGEYKTYGIVAKGVEEGREILVDSLSDISTDESLVKSLCTYCNERKVPPFMMCGVIEDFIG